MFHEDGNDYVDENELRHQNKDDEEDGRDERTDATVADAVSGRVAVVTKCVLRQPSESLVCDSHCR